MRADRRKNDPRAQSPLSDLQKLPAVLHHDGDVIAAVHARRAQQMGNLI